MVIKRKEIWWAALFDPRKSEPGYKRPVLILQTDEFNKSKIATVIVVILTSNLKLADAPGNVLLSKSETRLSKDSVANVSQIITLDKSFLTAYVSSLPNPLFRKIENGIRLILGL
jgi:mRNA interferase MazF